MAHVMCGMHGYEFHLECYSAIIDLPNIRLFHYPIYKVPFFPPHCISKISLVIYGSWSSIIKRNTNSRAKWCSGYNVLLTCMSRGGLSVRSWLVQYFFLSRP